MRHHQAAAVGISLPRRRGGSDPPLSSLRLLIDWLALAWLLCSLALSMVYH